MLHCINIYDRKKKKKKNRRINLKFASSIFQNINQYFCGYVNNITYTMNIMQFPEDKCFDILLHTVYRKVNLQSTQLFCGKITLGIS